MQNRFRRLLLPVDLSPVSDRVVRTAARLPIADGATVTLLHVVPRDLPSGDRETALDDAAVALAKIAKRFRSGAKGVQVRVLHVVDDPATGIARYAKTARAELIVMGRCRSPRGETFLGSTAERVIRRSQLPVLVVRRGGGRYRRPAIAIDTDGNADAAIGVLLRALHDARSVHVIRALELPYQSMYYRHLSAAQIAKHEAQYASEERERVDDMIVASLARFGAPANVANTWKHVLAAGAPRAVIPREIRRVKADLLALGTRGRTGLAYAYLGSVAGELLRSVECDVLVVPRRAGSGT